MRPSWNRPAIRRIVPCLAALMLLFSVPAPAASPVYERYSATYFDVFDTVTQLIAYAPDEATFQASSEAAHAEMQRLHRLFDGYAAYDGIANLYTLNLEAASAPVQISPELMALLQFCKQQQQHTRNTMNIALGSVLSIWHDYRDVYQEYYRRYSGKTNNSIDWNCGFHFCCDIYFGRLK